MPTVDSETINGEKSQDTPINRYISEDDDPVRKEQYIRSLLKNPDEGSGGLFMIFAQANWHGNPAQPDLIRELHDFDCHSKTYNVPWLCTHHVQRNLPSAKNRKQLFFLSTRYRHLFSTSTFPPNNRLDRTARFMPQT